MSPPVGNVQNRQSNQVNLVAYKLYRNKAVWVVWVVLTVLEIETWCMLGNYSTSELCPLPFLNFYFETRSKLIRLALNLESSRLSLPNG